MPMSPPIWAPIYHLLGATKTLRLQSPCVRVRKPTKRAGSGVASFGDLTARAPRARVAKAGAAKARAARDDESSPATTFQLRLPLKSNTSRLLKSPDSGAASSGDLTARVERARVERARAARVRVERAKVARVRAAKAKAGRAATFDVHLLKSNHKLATMQLSLLSLQLKRNRTRLLKLAASGVANFGDLTARVVRARVERARAAKVKAVRVAPCEGHWMKVYHRLNMPK